MYIYIYIYISIYICVYIYMVVTRKIMGPITHSYNRWIIRKLSNWMTPLRFQLTARRCKLSTDLQGDPSKVGRLRVQICPWLS